MTAAVVRRTSAETMGSSVELQGDDTSDERSDEDRKANNHCGGFELLFIGHVVHVGLEELYIPILVKPKHFRVIFLKLSLFLCRQSVMQKMTMKHFALKVRSAENVFCRNFTIFFQMRAPTRWELGNSQSCYFSLFRRDVLKGELRNDQDSLVEERISENAPTRKSATDVNHFFIH